jgi:hypothetical protein
MGAVARIFCPRCGPDPVPVTPAATVAESIAVGSPSLGWRALRSAGRSRS